MRTRVLFALTVVAALSVVASAEATWPRAYYGGTPMYTVPATPTYVSGAVIGGPMYASSGETYTIVERTGPFGFFRRQVMVATPAAIMPAPMTTATTGTPMPSTGVAPASATTTTTGVTTSGYLIQPTSTTTIMPATYTVVERTGPFGIFRRRVMIPTPAPVMPTPMPMSSTGMPMPSTGVTPASATTTVMPPTTSAGVITGGYIVPPAGTTTVMPATYTYRPFFRRGMMYSTMPMATDGTTYSTTPGSVVTATYTTPDMPTTTYVYPRRYFGWSGFGFWMR